jgi:HK97 family phage major capsid protein
MTAKQLLEERAELVAKARKINDERARPDGSLSPNDQMEFDRTMRLANEKYEAASRLRSLADEEASLREPFDRAVPPPNPGAGFGGAPAAAGKKKKAQYATLRDAQGRPFTMVGKGGSFAAAIADTPRVAADRETRAMMNDGLTLGGMIRASFTGPQTSAERAALSGASGSGGGYTVPEALSAQLIDKFRARMRMMEFGAQTIPLDSDTHTFVKITGDPTPGWRGEGVTIPESEPTFGALVFRPRSLAVTCKVSLELMQDSLNIGQAIERTMAESFAQAVDSVGMFGIGAAEQPLGLANEPGINVVTGVGTPDDYSEILDAYKLILDDNAPEPTGVIMSNRDWRTYAGLKDTTDQPLMRPKAIENLPFGPTSAVPTNQGGGGNESTMLMGYFPDYVFGIRAELQIEMLRELFRQTGHFAFVAMLRIDTAAFHPESFCKLTGVTSS